MDLGRKIADRMKAVNESLENNDLARLIPRYVTLDLQPTLFDAAAIKQLRQMLRIPQRVFAVMLGVSVKTVRSWEQGLKTPSPMACRFLQKVQYDPVAALEWLREMATKNAS